MKVRAHQYDTVDALCWRHYGRTQGVTEQVLKANPGLAEYGPFLPHGLRPALPKALLTRDRKTAPDDKFSDAAPDPCVTLTAQSGKVTHAIPFDQHQKTQLRQLTAGV